MSRTQLSPMAQNNRAAVLFKLHEHDAALDEHDAAIDALQRVSGFTATNGDSVQLKPGTPVAIGIASGSVRRGNASSVATSSILGLAVTNAEVTLPLSVEPDGALVLTTSQWDFVTGGSGGLVPGARYYLDTSPGKLTTTPPSAPGTCLVAIGRALSSTILVLHIQSYVLQ